MHTKPAPRGLFAFLAWVIIFCLFAAPADVLAQDGPITIRVNEAVADFPNTIDFFIKARANDNIDRVALVYGTSAVESCVKSQARRELIFDPAETIDLSWTWDMFRAGDLPPGAEIWWQWEIRTAGGAQLTTEVSRLTIVDPRFNWKEQSRGQITLHWAEGSGTFANTLLNIATSSLDRLAQTSNLTPEGDIHVFIYPSTEELISAMTRASEWMGGVSFSEYRIVLIGIEPDSGMAWPQAVIPHELAHVIFEQRTFNCLNVSAPAWLNEGMAEYTEGPVSLEERVLVLYEMEKGRLPPLTNIANRFPADGDLANLAYKQSKMMVDFIIETYGKEKLDALLDAYSSGKTTNEALRTVFGLDTAGLDKTWRASLGTGKAPKPDFTTPTPIARPTAIPTFALISPFETPAAAGQAVAAVPTQADPTSTAAATAEPTATATQAATAAPVEAVAAAQATAAPSESAVRVPNIALIAGLVAAGVLVLLVLAVITVRIIAKRRKDHPAEPQ